MVSKCPRLSDYCVIGEDVRNTNTCVRVAFEIGHEALRRTKKTPDGFTHDWEVFVRGADNTEIHHFVEKVVFHLHTTFPKPKRAIKEPPYSVKESGYAGFIIPIDIYFKNKDEPKKVTFNYDLSLQNSGPPIKNVLRETFVFPNPPEDLRRRLIRGGGVGVVGAEPGGQLIPTDKAIVVEDSSSKHVAPPLIGKPKLGGADTPKKHKTKDGDRISEQSVSTMDDFWHQKSKMKQQQQTLADCVEKQSSLKEGGQKHSDTTQALIYMICKDNLPLSCVEKSGLKRFSHVLCPHYKLPSRFKVTELLGQRYVTTKNILSKTLMEAKYISLTSDILTVTNSTRSFIVMTVHFLSATEVSIESFCLSAQRMLKAHTGEYIKEQFENITGEFSIDKNKIVAITTDGGSNMVAAVKLFMGENMRIPCMAHLINLIVDGTLKENQMFCGLADHIKSIVTFFKQSVNAMNDLRAEQEASGKKEGEVLTLIQSVSTRWNSCFDMLKRFTDLSATVAKILALRSLATKTSVPDMIPTSQLNVVRDSVALLGPFKQVTEEIGGENYVTASLAIPLSKLLRQEIEQAKPSTDVGVTIKKKLLKGISERLDPLEQNPFLAKATILDPRFKRLHFNSPTAVASAIADLSQGIRMEHRRKGEISPELPSPRENDSVTSLSLWSRHEKMVMQAASSQDVPSQGSVPNELKQYLDQPNPPRTSDPLKFWIDSIHFTPVLSNISQKYLIPCASSVPSERVASTVNIVVPDNRSRLTGEHVMERVFLSTIPDKYWFA